jgi:rhamnose utilization protein RhaD (predicted bifunctional aldolase and dehydrogenase)
MKNRWNESDEQSYMSRHSGKYHPRQDTEKEILSQAYATVLLGADKELTMHGGGNTSIKVNMVDSTGKEKRALYVKATGTPLDAFTPEHFVAMDLEFLEGLKSSGGIDDADMAREFREHQLVRTDRLPSIESLMHAFLPARVVAHSHPEALLKIANRAGGRELLSERFGGDLAVIPYARMGYDLASAVSAAAARNPGGRGVAIVHHGLVAWGETAREVYDFTIDAVNRAEKFLASMPRRPLARGPEAPADTSIKHCQRFAPAIKAAMERALSTCIDNIDIKISLALLNAADVMELIDSPDGRRIICEPPMTPDYPMARRLLPLWLDIELNIDIDRVSSYINDAIAKHAGDYKAYLEAHGVSNPPTADLLPRAVVIPKVGVVCAGADENAAGAAADYTRQAFSIRREIFETGGVYRCLEEEYLFDMRYRGYQCPKK